MRFAERDSLTRFAERDSLTMFAERDSLTRFAEKDSLTRFAERDSLMWCSRAANNFIRRSPWCIHCVVIFLCCAWFSSNIFYY